MNKFTLHLSIQILNKKIAFDNLKKIKKYIKKIKKIEFKTDL